MSATGDPKGAAPTGLLARAIARPITVTSAVLLVLLFGVIAVAGLPIQLTPDITTPTVTVSTRWPGASPIEVEAEILEEQEEVLKRVQGLVRMESTASLNSGSIDLEFAVGTDLEQALVRVTNQLSQVPSYPESADQPIVSTAAATGPLLAVILVRHEDGETVAPYRTWVEEEIVPQLERVKGVASIFIRGGRASEVHINFDVEALAARGLTVPFVAARVREAIRNRSAGELDVGKRRLLVRTMVTADTVGELDQLVLDTGPDATPILLSDVADVEVGLRRAADFAIGDDRESIALLPRREAGTNVLEVTEELRDVVEQLDERYFAPEGLELEIVDDQTDYIYDALDRVQVNLVIGAILATITLLIFLRSIAASAVVAVAIPMCMMGTALAMAMLGRSVNVVSLAGVTFAVGMVVDNSIVALENIDTWRRKEPDTSKAALGGIREVWGALLASTATTAAVFIPILLWEGEVGELLRDIAWAISVAVLVSFFVSVLVIPSFAARMLARDQQRRDRSGGDEGAVQRFKHRFDGIIGWAEKVRRGITDTAAWIASNAGRAAATVGVGVGGAIVIAWLLLPSMEYLPTGNRNLLFGIVLPPPGYSIEELKVMGEKNQAEMMRHTGRVVDGVPAVERSFFVGDPARIFIGGVAEDPNQIGELRDFLKDLHAEIPGSIGFVTQAALFSTGIGEGRAVELEIAGPDLAALIGFGRQLFGELQQLIPGSQVRPIPVLDLGAPELHVIPNRAQLAALGMTPSDVALVADAYVDGAIVGEFGPEGERKIDVVVKSNGGIMSITDDRSLLQAPVATPDGEIVPFGSIADVKTRLGPTVIQRIERNRAVVLQLTPPDEVPFETAIEAVEDKVEQLRSEGAVPSGLKLSFGGSAGKLVKAQRQFGEILLIALVILYLLLAGLFEDFVAPLVVLITVPLAAAGGLLGLAASDALLAPQPLDLMSALGFLILIGVVVNNAILIVDGAMQRLREGVELEQATSQAVEARVRPIFMSTLTSIAGLAPMVLTGGSGSELYRGVGTIVLGGLASSTLLSLFLVPGLFVLLWRARQKTVEAVT